MLTQGLSLEEAALRLAIPKGTLGNWVSVAKGRGDPTAPPGSRSVSELETEVAKLRKELAVERMEKKLKKGHRVLCQGVAARYAFAKSERLDYPLGLLCRVFQISRNGFYAWLGRPPSAHAQYDERLKVATKAARVQTRETYGVLRLWPELRPQDFDTGRDQIVRLRKERVFAAGKSASSR
jgi:transposase-like protein